MFKQLLVIMFLGLALSVPVQAAQQVFGPIGRTDTLWNIAEQLTPDKKASIQQVMLALYEKNKHAFTVNNINSLRKDAYMLAPTIAEVSATSRKSAIQMVQRHNARWKKRRYVPIHNPIPDELTRLLSADKTPEANAVPADRQQAVVKQDAKPVAKPVEAAQVTESATTSTETAPAALAVPETIVDGMPLQDQLRIVMQELNKARQENQLLKEELKQTREQQKQNLANNQQADPDIQVQLDALRRELAELRTILTQKDNHIKTLQSSLKSASEAIKSQHADNMRLYNKLKELSPESVPARAEQQQSAKPQIKLAAVTEDALTNDSVASDNEIDAAKVWADADDKTGLKPGDTATQPANDVKNSQAVSLSQLVQPNAAALTQSGNDKGLSGVYAVSPLAWGAVLLSFVFILFLVIRALVIQNEIRKFEREDDF